MFFVAISRDRPGSSALRAALKARHVAHLDAAAPGVRVLQSGPMLDPGGEECGSLLVLEADTVARVEAFVGRDPYRQAGLFAATEVRPWLWRRGNPHLVPAGAVDPGRL